MNCVKYSSRSKEYYNQIVLPNAHQDDGGGAPCFPKEAKPCWVLLVPDQKKTKTVLLESWKLTRKGLAW